MLRTVTGVGRKNSIRDAEPKRFARDRRAIRCPRPDICSWSAVMVHELMASLVRSLVSMLRSRATLLVENALLRQQIIVLRRAAPHLRFKARDRLAISATT